MRNKEIKEKGRMIEKYAEVGAALQADQRTKLDILSGHKPSTLTLHATRIHTSTHTCVIDDFIVRRMRQKRGKCEWVNK